MCHERHSKRSDAVSALACDEPLLSTIGKVGGVKAILRSGLQGGQQLALPRSSLIHDLIRDSMHTIHAQSHMASKHSELWEMANLASLQLKLPESCSQQELGAITPVF